MRKQTWQGGRPRHATAQDAGSRARARRSASAPPEQRYSTQFRTDRDGKLRVQMARGVDALASDASLEDVVSKLNELLAVLREGR